MFFAGYFLFLLQTEYIRTQKKASKESFVKLLDCIGTSARLVVGSVPRNVGHAFM